MVESWMAILAVTEVVMVVSALFAALKISGEVHRKADRELQMRWEHADPQSRRRWEAAAARNPRVPSARNDGRTPRFEGCWK